MRLVRTNSKSVIRKDVPVRVGPGAPAAKKGRKSCFLYLHWLAKQWQASQSALEKPHKLALFEGGFESDARLAHFTCNFARS